MQHYSLKETLVYLIPSANYVGITCDLKQRMRVHKKEFDLEGFEILAVCPNRKEALEIESIFHRLGCYGNKYVKSYHE